MAEAKPGGKHLTAKYDFKALQTIMKIDDDFKEDLVPFFGVEDVDSLPEAAENFDVNEICNVESADSAFAMTRDEQVAALVAIVPQETGADGKSRVRAPTWHRNTDTNTKTKTRHSAPMLNTIRTTLGL
mmetsp:Transcript_4550/g.9832  ORF Transcript_4550/g.9832 Transcript_4550/m.9832 type:complete len:129 (-) Transcript_4550:171-557(-)